MRGSELSAVLPSVSVVVPCFNGATFLEDTLNSALNQTHRPQEIIVVDDGSTDESANIAESFGHPVQVLRQENQGESVARNRGIDEAKGEWIAFLDADDFWTPEKLERQLQAVDDDAVGCVCNVFYFGEVNKPAKPWGDEIEKLGSLEHICRFNSFLPTSMIVKKTESPRFATWTRFGEDYLFSLDLAMQGRVAFVDEPLAGYRIHRNSQSAQPQAIVEQDKSFVRWFEENAHELGQERAAELRRLQVDVLTRRLRGLRHARRWNEFHVVREYLATLDDEPVVRAMLSERIWPPVVYRAVDWVDAVIPQLRRRLM